MAAISRQATREHAPASINCRGTLVRWGERKGVVVLLGPPTVQPPYTSPVNLISMSYARNIIPKYSYPSLFLTLILLFSLPTTTVALDVSYSPTTQCGPYHLTWDDSVVLSTL